MLKLPAGLRLLPGLQVRLPAKVTPPSQLNQLQSPGDSSGTHQCSPGYPGHGAFGRLLNPRIRGACVYINDVLGQLLSGSTDYASLRADVWKQSHPESIRKYRSEERRDAADRKRFRRARRRLLKQAPPQPG